MFAFTTDWHLTTLQPINRSGDVLEDTFSKIEQLFSYCKMNNLPIIHGGDIFHQNNVTYSVLNRLIGLIKQYDIKMYVVLGNHDLIGSNAASEGTAIHTLLKAGIVEKLDDLTLNNYKIKGIHYTDNVIGNPDADILVAHLPLLDVNPDEKVPYEHIKLCELDIKAKLVLSGHIHSPFTAEYKTTKYYNPGCFSRRNVREADLAISFYHIRPDLTVNSCRIEYKKDVFKPVIKDKTISKILVPDHMKIEEVDIKKIIQAKRWKPECKAEILKRLELKA